jgi:hypothetical protein
MYGYRFFRDDLLLKEYKKRKRCQRCKKWFWPDEGYNTFLQKNVCTKCANLMGSRLRSILNPKKSCPTNPEDFIFTKKLHVQRMDS